MGAPTLDHSGTAHYGGSRRTAKKHARRGSWPRAGNVPQRTIPCRGTRALPGLGGYNALNLVFRRRVLRDTLVPGVFKQGETEMGDKGKKDKGKREQRKKALRTPDEKRKLKKEKKNK